MPFETRQGVRFFQFAAFPQERVCHAVFTRQGGVSPAPWHSLNVGGTVGDDIARVRANRVRAFNAVGRDPASLHDVWQVHGADVVVADAPRPLESPYTKADILLTQNPQVTLFMRFADCVPLLFYDPVQGAVGIAHSGWQGTVKGVARETVRAMAQYFGSQPQHLVAAIGPSIGPDHYEVGADVVKAARQAFGEKSQDVLRLNRQTGRYHFDLWTANRIWLEEAGVAQIHLAGLCTACHTDDWYSHRAEHGQTGRFGALIALKQV